MSVVLLAGSYFVPWRDLSGLGGSACTLDAVPVLADAALMDLSLKSALRLTDAG